MELFFLALHSCRCMFDKVKVFSDQALTRCETPRNLASRQRFLTRHVAYSYSTERGRLSCYSPNPEPPDP
eukprot:scaffold355687_cov28-Prasinocladus_malaysianus.AAC.1